MESSLVRIAVLLVYMALNFVVLNAHKKPLGTFVDMETMLVNGSVINVKEKAGD